jgi:1-acyl-sn-glycerol-3-phosphate acyltransferase
VLRAITDEIMYELMKLSGQEYVDVYASSMKKPKGAPAKTSTTTETPAVRTAE